MNLYLERQKYNSCFWALVLLQEGQSIGGVWKQINASHLKSAFLLYF